MAALENSRARLTASKQTNVKYLLYFYLNKQLLQQLTATLLKLACLIHILVVLGIVTLRAILT